jgi:hypothetical protein
VRRAIGPASFSALQSSYADAVRAQATSASQGRSSPRCSFPIDKASLPHKVRVGNCGNGTLAEGLLGVRLRLSDPELAENLRDFLERRECAVVQIDADTLEVELPHEHHAEQARLELDLYLRVWQSLHHWSRVEYVA